MIIFLFKNPHIMSFLKQVRFSQKREFPLRKDGFTKFQWFLRREVIIKINKVLSLIFYHLPLGKGIWPFFWKVMNPLPNIACAKIGYNFLWPEALEKEFFFNFVYIVLLFHYYLLFKKCVILFKRVWKPFTRRALCC